MVVGYFASLPARQPTRYGHPAARASKWSGRRAATPDARRRAGRCTENARRPAAAGCGASAASV